jgi:hypothetical protein
MSFLVWSIPQGQPLGLYLLSIGTRRAVTPESSKMIAVGAQILGQSLEAADEANLLGKFAAVLARHALFHVLCEHIAHDV